MASTPSTTTYSTVTSPSGAVIAVLTMTNPPVNSLSRGTRSGMVEGVRRALDPANKIQGIIVRGAGRAFCAGAEITEFASSNPATQDEPLPRTLDRLEECSVPVVALVHGFALGGGMEVALSCHYRVLTKDANMGLPEVDLGLLPGAGGTQRLPRVVGPVKAAEMILSGRPVNAAQAKALGLADVVAQDAKDEASRLAAALAFIDTKLGKPSPVRGRAIPAEPDLDAKLAAALKAAQAKRRGEIAPGHIVACVRAAVTKPTFEEGMREETRLFSELLASSEARALQHVFFAERATQKLPKELTAEPAPLKKIGIVGAGLMGGGIATVCAEAGIPVIVLDAKQEFLDKGIALIKLNLDKSVERKSITPAQRDQRLALIQTTLDYASFRECDLVVEAVFEDMKLKKEIFKKLDAVCKPGCVLASNTSGLDIDEIAATTSRPQDVIGCHFFSPVPAMRLLENVRGSKSSARTVSTAMDFGRRINKVAVLVGNCPGFLGNRMFWNESAEAEKLAIEGAPVQRVDHVFEKVLGANMGPFRTADLVGLELFHRKRKAEGRADAKRIVEDALCEAGRFGQRSGKGYYTYKDGRTAEVDPAVEKILETVAANRGVRRRGDKITEQEIFERLIYPLINEGFKCLDEGIATKSSDVDVTFLYGYGWPKWRGGPLKLAEEIGPDVILSALNKYRRWGHREEYWIPAKGLVERAAKVQAQALASAASAKPVKSKM